MRPSLEGKLSCGGGSGNTQKTCVKWSPASGTWTQSHTLRQKRNGHVSWSTASGVYLIGGTESSRTSEKVKLDGSVEEGFGLKYNIRLKSGIELIYLHKDIFTFFASFSCAIPDPFKEEVMITGGRGTTNQVSINNN